MDEPKQITRQQYNMMICDLLIAAVQRYPDWRFGQILRNLELAIEIRDVDTGMPIAWTNDFNVESSEIFGRVHKYKEIMKSLGAEIDNNALMATRRLKLHKKKRKSE